MPRHRKSDTALPPRVYRTSSGAYRYNPLGEPSRTIATKNARLHEIWAAYDAVTAGTDMTGLAYFAEQYYQSNNFEVLAPRTKADLRDCEKKPVVYFNGLNCTRMKPQDINLYIKLRFKTAPRRANYELTWFRNVFSNAVAEGLHPGPSPAGDIKPMRLSREAKKEAKAKKRLVSDEDYQAMYEVMPLAGKIAMEIAYCTGCRPGDVLKIRRQDITGGIEIEENKTGHAYAKQITPRLAAALELAKTLPGQPFGGWVIRNQKGNQYTVSGWGTNWKKWAKVTKEQYFTFQEIRIKAISEAEGNKQEFSMHSNAKMLGVYDRSLKESPSHK